MPLTSLGKIAVGRQIQLRDGRRIGFAEYGDPNGKPVVLLHPLPGSRLFRHPDESIADALGVRLITIDRPGFGLSDAQPNRKLLSWPDDVSNVVSALGIDRFAVVGVGAGGVFAAACAYKLNRRLVAAGLVSSLSPLHIRGAREGMNPMLRNFFFMAYRAPRIFRLTMYFGAREAQTFPEKYLSRLDDPPLCASDRALLIDDPEIRAMSLENIGEAFHNQSTPYSDELILLSRPWGFRLRDIRIPVFLWHGERDTLSPPQMGRYLAEEIPACTPHFFPNEGHAVMFTHWEDILSTIVSEFERQYS